MRSSSRKEEASSPSIHDLARESLGPGDREVFDTYNRAMRQLVEKHRSGEISASPGQIVRRAYREVSGSKRVLRKYDRLVGNLSGRENS